MAKSSTFPFDRFRHDGSPELLGTWDWHLLMESILDLADNWLNLKRIDLDANDDNRTGIRLYKKFGFAVEGTKRYHIY